MGNYQNECDPRAAAWLRELVRCGYIPPARVDDRSIVDVRPGDLSGYVQCHFFAGIGGWDLALELAGWPADRAVWTGSCPCQPFSVAGKQLGTADQRHLWPVWFGLIRECRPPVVFGEQVASAAALGWLDGVFADLEGEGYACAAADLCAAGVGAPHIRQRIYWVGYTKQPGLEGHTGHGSDRGESGRVAAVEGRSASASGAAGSWDRYDVAHCTDGTKRRVESGVFPLADGFPGRVGILRGYGNAIVPPLAATFIRSVMDVLEQPTNDKV